MAEEFTVVPLSPIRKVIAVRMAEAKRTIPHFRVTAELDADALLEARRTLQAQRPEVQLSLNDLLIKACAAALIETPAMNVQWAETAIHQYESADISVVTALAGGGVSTPIVRSADTKSVWEISREIKELAARAARNQLRMGEILGGTFSVSNLGMHDVDQFDAIINPPQCAILAVGTAKPRAVVSSSRDIRVVTTMRMTVSADHRALDGTIVAAFLTALRAHVERPDSLHVPKSGD